MKNEQGKELLARPTQEWIDKQQRPIKEIHARIAANPQFELPLIWIEMLQSLEGTIHMNPNRMEFGCPCWLRHPEKERWVRESAPLEPVEMLVRGKGDTWVPGVKCPICGLVVLYTPNAINTYTWEDVKTIYSGEMVDRLVRTPEENRKGIK